MNSISLMYDLFLRLQTLGTVDFQKKLHRLKEFLVFVTISQLGS